MTEPASKSEFVRLGKRGSYRLGALGTQGLGQPAGPRPLRFSAAPPQHRGPVLAWLLAAIAMTGLIWAAAAAGIWFMPFLAGLAAGIAARFGGWRLRVTLPAVVIMTAAGWGLALWIPALAGLPVGATGRVIAALAGLPASAVTGVGVALAVGALQGLAGLWLGRALTPRPPRD